MKLITLGNERVTCVSFTGNMLYDVLLINPFSPEIKKYLLLTYY